MVLQVVEAPVRNIPHWIPATRQALADAPRMRSIIENFLQYGIRERIEDQVVDGNGTSPNLRGILNISGATAQAFDTNMLDTLRKARTKVRLNGRGRPNAYAMNPLDWEKIELAQDDNYRYYGAGPFAMTPPRLWGLPVLECEAIPEGTVICADWSLARIWDRQAATMYVSDSHADFFVRNMIAILIEQRLAFDLIRPAAFVIADVTP
jgi:HK97 family phage major capsid protein